MSAARAINEKQARMMFAYIATQRNASRNDCAFALSYYAGLRVKEIASLRIGDVLTANGEVKEVVRLDAAQTKGNRAREIFFNTQCRKHIKAHVAQLRFKDASDALIQVMGKRKAFSANSLAIAMRNLYLGCGLDGCSSHSGRKSAISALANKGVGISVIQKFSGHRSLQAVQHYISTNEALVKSAAELIK